MQKHLTELNRDFTIKSFHRIYKLQWTGKKHQLLGFGMMFHSETIIKNWRGLDIIRRKLDHKTMYCNLLNQKSYTSITYKLQLTRCFDSVVYRSIRHFTHLSPQINTLLNKSGMISHIRTVIFLNNSWKIKIKIDVITHFYVKELHIL